MQINKERLTELSNNIKELLEKNNMKRMMLRIADTNEDFNIDELDDDRYDANIDLEDKYQGWGMDCETRLVSYDCGGYSRTLQLDGVVIEDDVLKFYLTEVFMSNKGDDDDETWKEDLNGLIDGRGWWLAGGNPEVEFDPERVLEFYVSIFEDEDFKDVLEFSKVVG